MSGQFTRNQWFLFAAVVTGALIALVLGLPWWIVLLAVAAIGAAICLKRWLDSRQSSGGTAAGDDSDARDAQVAHQAAFETVADMREQATGLDSSEARELMLRTCDHLDGILAAIATPERLASAPLIVDQLVEPAQASLTDALWLARRGEGPSQDLLRRIESQDFPTLEYVSRSIESQVGRPGPLDMVALERSLGFTLQRTDSAPTAGPASWGNRQRLVEEAERQRGG